MIEFEGACGCGCGKDLRLSLVVTDLDDAVPLNFCDSIDVAEISRERYHIVNYSRKRHVGSVAWDQVAMYGPEAKRLLKALLKSELVQVDQCDSGHPFEELVL